MRCLKAEDILERGVEVKYFELKEINFRSGGSDTGRNARGFGFCTTEHIDLDLKCDPSTGNNGIELYVLRKHARNRILKRRSSASIIGKLQAIYKEEDVK